MLHTVIKKNLYQDSVSLMLLTNHISSLDGVNQIQVMMGTPANKDIFKVSSLYTDELEEASPNDLCIVVDAANESKVQHVVEEVDNYLTNQTSESQKSAISIVRTWEMAENKLPNANLALISIAGEYAVAEANKALDRKLNVFLFSDNVSARDELQLKERAINEGLIVMGPDCGTGILEEVPIAFANVVEKGNIGVVGASGTGIQEVTTLIGKHGGGISQAIGTGGRDLSADIGALTTIKGLQVLDADLETDVIVFISKPPAPEVRKKVVEVFKTLSKPVVAVFMGDKPAEQHDNVHYAWTLEDTANKALELAKISKRSIKNIVRDNQDVEKMKQHKNQRCIKGYFCGGTLALESATIMKETFTIDASTKQSEGMMLASEGHEVIDLGDDAYTVGRAHPMIDPTYRIEKVKEAAKNPETAIILLDNVIGYGAHEDMAGVVAPVVEDAKREAAKEERSLIVIASVTGTADDPQVFQDQVDKLEDAGVIVAESNAQATKLATEIINYLGTEKTEAKTVKNSKVEKDAVSELLSSKPRVINVGLSSFAEAILEHGGQVVQYQWAPIAGGNKRLAGILEKLK
ncbi:acyl-CoA synthetase FdrA [Virgibacillus sp. NKC19-3]|uniref:acyl-CoA synthetase FdrA n=1 Tax=Virgibacillus saliphilus TaxID=2831674 RepID=UPI001C9A5335|nr:acyl-CoA synthetase FdrA [Virgibacillus sp. NKC19-3]MBY7144219.1 acyl-CoA synthetase FdrA [Virgibacillus sp. NKC19-3]